VLIESLARRMLGDQEAHKLLEGGSTSRPGSAQTALPVAMHDLGAQGLVEGVLVALQLVPIGTQDPLEGIAHKEERQRTGQEFHQFTEFRAGEALSRQLQWLRLRPLEVLHIVASWKKLYIYYFKHNVFLKTCYSY